MRRDSSNTHENKTHTCCLRALYLTMLAAAAFVCSSSLSGETQAETVSYCRLLKAPAAFDGKMIRITGVYKFSFETQRLFPSSCCEDLDPKMWVEFGELDRKSRKLVHRFPKGTGMVLGTFVGRLDYGHSPNPQGAQFTLTITAVESVERVTNEVEKVAWAPPFCKQ